MSRQLSNFSLIVSSIKTEREGPPAAQHTQLSSTPSGPAGANVCQAQDLFPLKPRCREFTSPGSQASLSLQPQSHAPVGQSQFWGTHTEAWGRLEYYQKGIVIQTLCPCFIIQEFITHLLCARHSDSRTFQELPGFGDTWKSETEHSYSEFCDLEQVTQPLWSSVSSSTNGLYENFMLESTTNRHKQTSQLIRNISARGLPWWLSQ